MKRFLIFLLLIFLISFQSVFADEKITSVNYDTSANMLFIASTSNEKLTDNIKVVTLSNPNRIYFDIPNSVLTTEKQDYQISSGGDLRQIVVSQNSTNPNIVRVVIYFAENYKTSNVKLYRLNNNIIVKFNNQVCYDANYMRAAYRDDKFENTDYYSFISMFSQNITAEEKPLVQTVNGSQKVLNQIQQAFENSTVPVNIKTSYQNANVKVSKKDFKLKTNYYLKGVQAKNNGILLSGMGAFSIERPIPLNSPNRLVFDLPNTLTDANIRSKTFQYGSDTVRIGQFEANKARVVITTDNHEKYIPIYSVDNQSVLIANKETLNHDKLTNIMTNLASAKVTKVDNKNYGLNFYFTKPVVYAIKRDDNNLTIYFFNAVQFNDQDFKSTVRGTEMSSSRIDLMPRIGLRYSLQLEKGDSVKVYSGADARTIKLALKTSKKETLTQRTPEVITELPTKNPEKIIKPRKSGDKVVVIDPGHGGIDYGAIRSGINEKDITTDVSARVAKILKSDGFKVYLTRDEDKTLSLQERVDFAEENNPDIFVSIHVNSSEGTTATGIETHYYHDYSIGLAKVVHAAMAKYINSKDRGLFKSKFYVINHTTMPAILVEIGFISNEDERQDMLTEKRKQATAKAIAEGIKNYYKQQQKEQKELLKEQNKKDEQK
ncbi:N-acetylmuramoyl-L-alanine amidase [bacterium]|nr:N-acetylmuramoyl-L-alanine amidase [bacterium]